MWKLEGGRESRQRSNCTTTLVKWSDCGDFLGVKSGTTAIAGGVVSSIELFSYAEHQSGSRRRSTDVCESRQVVRQQACRLFPFMVCRLNGARLLYYCVDCCYLIYIDLCPFIKLSFLYLLIVSQVIHLQQGNHTVAVRLVFAD